MIHLHYRAIYEFVFACEIQMVGTGDFNNGGVQFRSQRVPNHYEVSGYQLTGGWWGCFYDESRHNKVLVEQTRPDELSREMNGTTTGPLRRGSHSNPAQWRDYG
jgi:hypothetical protein